MAWLILNNEENMRIPPNVAHPDASIVHLKDQKDRGRRRTSGLSRLSAMKLFNGHEAKIYLAE